MDVSQNYRKVEFAIKQGGVKFKNEPKPSWQKYILDFLFYKRLEDTKQHEELVLHLFKMKLNNLSSAVVNYTFWTVSRRKKTL